MEPILADGDGSPANIGNQAGSPANIGSDRDAPGEPPAPSHETTGPGQRQSDDEPTLAEGDGSPANIGNQAGSPANIGSDRDAPGEPPAPSHETAGPDQRQSDDEPILADGRAPAPEQPPANIGTDEAEHDDIPDDAFESITPVAEDPANIGWRSRPRIERTGSLKAPDGKGAFWVWRWWELNGSGEKVRKSRYGGKVQTETARDYWAPATANIG